MAPRARFAGELRTLQDEVVSLGHMVGVAIDQSVEALRARDTDWARRASIWSSREIPLAFSANPRLRRCFVLSA